MYSFSNLFFWIEVWWSVVPINACIWRRCFHVSRMKPSHLNQLLVLNVHNLRRSTASSSEGFRTPRFMKCECGPVTRRLALLRWLHARCTVRPTCEATLRSGLSEQNNFESVNIHWVANKRFVSSKFKFKFPRARNLEIIGLVLGCIEAKVCK